MAANSGVWKADFGRLNLTFDRSSDELNPTSMKNEPKRPPKVLEKLLSRLCKGELLEEILGDLEEYHYELLEQPKWKRRLFYWFQVVNFLRPFALRGITAPHYFNHTIMFRNYIKVSLRGLMKNPVNSFINVFGLAVAIGICIFTYAFARWTYNTDQFHQHKEEVYLVTFSAKRDGTLQQFGQTPRPLGAMLREDFAQVKKICRVEDANVIVKAGANVFHEKVRYADPEFLEMLTFPLKRGNPASLHDPSSIILSADMAVKYFGDVDPIGEEMLLKFSENSGRTFKVTGVAEKFPEAHTIDFHFLINFENLYTSSVPSVPGYDIHDWGRFVNATLIQVEKPADLHVIEQGMGKYRDLQNKAAEEDWAVFSYGFEQLASLHRKSSAIRDDISYSSDAKYDSIIFLSIITVFLLVLACFNYINIAIVSAAKRLKEIGVRKTIGASRSVVIVQFLTENVVITFFALVIGVVLGTFVFVPWLENLNSFDMGFTLLDQRLWIYLPAVLLITGIASGIYPSIYISSFPVVGILKGSVRFGKKNPLTKVLLGVQLVLACVLITAGVLFNQNTTYMAERSWGYNQKQALYVAVPHQAAFEKMKARMVESPDIISVSGAEHHLGKNHTTTVAHQPDRQVEVDQLSVDAGYFETMGLQFIAGQSFREHYEADKKTIVVNEALAKSIGLDAATAIGQLFRIDSTQHEVVGVVKDFHSYSFFKKVKPAIFRVANEAAYRYLTLKVQPGKEYEANKAVQAEWASLFPEIPFDGGFQEDVWGNYFEELEVHASVWRGFAILAVVLASLGLYGLVTLNVAGRVKEFSIRKILGAGLPGIAGNITRQYVVLFAVALLVGAPTSYMLNKALLDWIYWYHVPVTYGGVFVAVAILVLVLLLTVAIQVRRVARENPVGGLRVE